MPIMQLCVDVLSPDATARLYGAAVLIFLAAAVVAIVNDDHRWTLAGMSVGLAILAGVPAWNSLALS